MTIARVNPILTDVPSQGTPRSSTETGADFAAVARSVAAGDLEAARKALASAGAPRSIPAQTLAQTLADGNLAAARFALAQLGAPAAGTAATAGAGPDVTLGPPLPVPGPDVTLGPPLPVAGPGIPGAPGPVVPPQKNRIATAVEPPVSASANGMVVADVGATLGTSATSASPSGATVTSANGTTYAVSDVLVALALGNAGSIPADVINLYGPGGAKYDPAAIMDAYRNSALGQAQMAALAWIGRPV